jgi:hypothetical protein
LKWYRHWREATLIIHQICENVKESNKERREKLEEKVRNKTNQNRRKSERDICELKNLFPLLDPFRCINTEYRPSKLILLAQLIEAPIKVTSRSKALTVSTHSNAEIVDSNPTESIDV